MHIMQLVGPVVEGPKGSVNGAVSSGTSFGDDVGGGGGARGGVGQEHAVIQQDGYAVRVLVRRRQVKATIPIEVPYCC